LDIDRFLTLRNSSSFGRNSLFILSSEGLVIIISSAYLITQIPLRVIYSLVLCLGLLGLKTDSSPFSAMLHNIGEITPPCGVP
jgi:hypothetical protein